MNVLCMHLLRYTLMYTLRYTYTYACVCARVCLSIFVHKSAHKRTCIYVYTHEHTQTHIHMDIPKCTHTHTHIFAYIYLYVHMYHSWRFFNICICYPPPPPFTSFPLLHPPLPSHKLQDDELLARLAKLKAPQWCDLICVRSLMLVCDRTHSCVQHDLLMCETGFIHVCSMTC